MSYRVVLDHRQLATLLLTGLLSGALLFASGLALGLILPFGVAVEQQETPQAAVPNEADENVPAVETLPIEARTEEDPSAPDIIPVATAQEMGLVTRRQSYLDTVDPYLNPTGAWDHQLRDGSPYSQVQSRVSFDPSRRGGGRFSLRFEEYQLVPEGVYGNLIYRISRQNEVNPQLVAAVIQVESAFNPKAVSNRGARGLMQVMPDTAKRFGVDPMELFEPEANLEAGIGYLSWLIDHFRHELRLVLAAYNAGERAVEEYGDVPPYRETQGYVSKVYEVLAISTPREIW